MPHLVMLYTPNLETDLQASVLCRSLCDAMLAVRDEAGKAVFPVGGTRVFALQAAHFAVSDGVTGVAAGGGEHAFIYFNVRMAPGRSAAVKQALGESLTAIARAHMAPILARRGVGLTLQIDEAHEVFDAKFGNLHALFAKPG